MNNATKILYNIVLHGQKNALYLQKPNKFTIYCNMYTVHKNVVRCTGVRSVVVD